MNKSKFLFIILLFVLGCSTKYTRTGEVKTISEEIKDVSYSVKKVSEPNRENPYLVLNTSARGTAIKTINEEFQVKKEISLFAPIVTSALGIGSWFLLNSQGLAVLGRDIGILSIGSSCGMVAYNFLQKPKEIWKEKVLRNQKEFIPAKGFSVKLSGTEYYSTIIPDRDGDLKINILEFAPFYKEGMPFYIGLSSPTKEKLGEYRVNTKSIAARLLKAKTQKYPPMLSFTVSFDDSTGDRDFFLDADETGRIVLVIKNTGRGIAQDLEIRLTPSKPLPYINIPSSKKVAQIGLMEEKRIIIPISASRETPTGAVEKLKIEVLEPYFQADANSQYLSFETRKFELPSLALHDKGVEQGQIIPGESADISFVLQNKGAGRAENVTCEVRVPIGITYLGEKADFDFGTMEPGVWNKIDFPIFVGKRFQGDTLKIALDLRERRAEFSKNIEVFFPLNRPIQKPKEYVVKGKEKIISGITAPPVLTVDVDVDIPETKMKNTDAIAVIIANKSYENPDVPNVEFADNDGRILKEYLIKTLGYKENNIIYEPNAKKSGFERIFGIEKEHKGELYNYVKAHKSDVFIYYTGHGAPDIKTRSGYFVPVECHPDYVSLNGYALETFYKNLLKIPARSITVVIDACFSGNSEEGMLIAQASPLTVGPIPKEVSGDLNLFTSSGSGEISSWYKEKKHSLFTYFFLKGLQGEGDKNNDKKITLGELKEYVSEKVSYLAKRKYGGRLQTPTFKGDESKIIVRLK